MTARPVVSILIVNYNGAAYIADCLASIFQLDWPWPIEVILVDNASSDASLDAIRNTGYPVQLLANSKNMGFAAANNQAASQATGRYLLLLNNDTILVENPLPAMIDYFDTHPEIGAMGPRLTNPDHTRQRTGSIFSQFQYKRRTPRSVSFISGAAFLIPAALYHQLNGLDEAFFFYNEDLDLCLRIRKAGKSLIYFPLSEIIHLGGVATQTRKAASIIEGYRGGMVFCRKHYGLFAFHLYRYILLIELVIRAGIYRLNAIRSPETCNEAYMAIVHVIHMALSGHIERKDD